MINKYNPFFSLMLIGLCTLLLWWDWDIPIMGKHVFFIALIIINCFNINWGKMNNG